MPAPGQPRAWRGFPLSASADETRAVVAIVTIGALLRLFGAWRAGLSYDESLIWACVRDLDLSREALASAAVDHPPLGALIVRSSAWIFGTSDLGLRLLHTLAAAAAPFIVYRLGRALWTPDAGLLAAALLAVDQFHVSWSRLFVEDGLLLTFEAGALLLWWRAATGSGRGRWTQAGLVLGLTVLLKETAILLGAALFLSLMLDRRGRAALRTPGPAAAALVCLAIVGAGYAVDAGRAAPGFLDRDADIVAQRWGLSAKALSLYVGEALRAAVDTNALDSDYGRVPARAMWWPVGAAYLVAVLASLRRAGEPGTRLLLLVFGVVFVTTTLVDADKVFEPYWWAALTVVPAVLLGARALELQAARRHVALPALAVGLAVALALVDVSWLTLATEATPRRSRTEWAEALAADGLERLRAGDHASARHQARTALILDPRAPAAQALADAIRAAGTPGSSDR